MTECDGRTTVQCVPGAQTTTRESEKSHSGKGGEGRAIAELCTKKRPKDKTGRLEPQTGRTGTKFLPTREKKPLRERKGKRGSDGNKKESGVAKRHTPHTRTPPHRPPPA